MKRRLSVGLVDQAVIALANAANPILAAALLDRRAAGIMLFAVVFAYFANGLGRAFVCEVLLTLAPRLDGEERRTLVRDGAATALCYGVLASLVLVGLWATGIDSLRDLVWAAPAVPLILLQDTGRHTALADGKPARALVIDATWVGTQAALIAVLVVADAVRGATLLLAWGTGASVAAGLWLLRDRVNPLRGTPRGWITRTRHLAGWFTATALVGQTHTLVIATSVVNFLDPVALAILRLAQTGVLQPVQNLVTAMNSMLVPRASRLAAAGDAQGLRRQTFRMAGGLGALGVVIAVIAALSARPFLELALPKYVDAATLAVPIAIQATIYLLQVPFTAALRGMHRPKSLLVQYLIFSAVSLTGLVLGAWLGGLRAAVWGLAFGSAFGLGVMIAQYLLAERALRAGATPAPSPAPAP
ncbi:hypothetical protein Val02_83880 [Virgisporangium aliadipatigenens]|uniref:Membrane protein involved in the export of O-antigen and teichoic acid n=1 Tax=Virgisporangium aliadipatigenens TaxID=741659 RepID=A0A8J3YVZ5_9ACTN|nr:hypothetical protein [Virgisporangium aliadipatigenens]GIJ51502.1 hypothetical protein Val02_83880 [Virgisporangium aliadipatigenens]